MKQIISIAVVLGGIFGGFFWFFPFGSGYFLDKVLPSLIGTGVGAWLAFHVKRLQDASEEVKRRKAAGNLALFTLVQQLTDLLKIEAELAEWRPETKKATRWIEMRPILGFSDLPAISVEDLSWLLELDDKDLLGRLMAARNGYLTVMGLLDLRKQVKGKLDDHLESLEREMLKEGKSFSDTKIPVETLRDHLTSREMSELTQSAELLLEHSSNAFHYQYEVMESLHRALMKTWPKGAFVRAEPKASLLKRINLDIPPPSNSPFET